MPIESSIDRFVGGRSEEQARAERAADELARRQDPIPGEVPKTFEHVEMLMLVNKEMAALRHAYGLDPYQVSPRYVHYVEELPASMREEKNQDESLEMKACNGVQAAGYNGGEQRIVITQRGSRISVLASTFHEVLHANSYNSMDLEAKDADLFLSTRRTGLGSDSRGSDGILLRHFQDLNEAVTEELTVRFVHRMAETDPSTRSAYRELEQSLLASGCDSEQAARVSASELHSIKTVQTESGEKEFVMSYFGYPNERQALNLLVDKLFEKNARDYADREKVFDLFVKAALHGSLLDLARLIEKTFGQGAFRKIGSFQGDGESFLAYVESL